MKKILKIILILMLPTSMFSMKPTPKLNVYVFLQADCPCIYSHKDSFGKLLRQYSAEVNFKLVFEGKEDTKAQMETLVKQLDWKVSCVKDENQQLLKLYKPTVSTDCVVFDARGRVLFRGAIDDGVKNMGMIRNFYLQEVIKAFLLQNPIPYSYAPGTGCTLVEN